MREVGLALVGAWLYLACWLVLEPRVGAHWGAFLLGYMLVAVLDLWRCWRSVRTARTDPLSLAFAALLLFPVGSLLWLPWDASRALRA